VKRQRVAILLSGGGSNMMALLNSMRGDHPGRPCLVLSNELDAGGLALAAARKVPVAVVDHRAFPGDRAAFEAQLMKPLKYARPDIICLAGFMRVLSEEFVAQWQGRMLNIHPSLLPKYRGLNTHARVLEAGDAEHGCSVHEVTAELDNGPVLGQAKLPVAGIGDGTPALPRRTAPVCWWRQTYAQHGWRERFAIAGAFA